MSWASNGKYFGYPQCCIFEFVGLLHLLDGPDSGPRKLSGTGFIPCKSCNEKKTEDQLRREIAANRMCPVPFPDGECP